VPLPGCSSGTGVTRDSVLDLKVVGVFVRFRARFIRAWGAAGHVMPFFERSLMNILS
jgi:hypothetical protein